MKIGLVAMSGVRAYDQELMEMGLTLPGFVERSKTIASLPSLGLLTLAGMTPKPHRLTYIDVPHGKIPAEVDAGFDLVAISALSAQIPEAYRLARIFRERGAQVVIGGLHVTALPEEALEHADAVAVGEGEVTWPRILEDARRGKLGGIYRAEEEFNLARSPMPAYELLDLERYNRITLQTHRGCPWQCTFCASSILLTPRYKSKPVGRVLRELDRIIALWPRPFIEFADDNSFCRKDYWRELLPEIRKRRIRWFTETDLSIHEDPELLRLMAESGCAQVLIGLESPNPAGMEGLELKGDWKRRQVRDYGRAIRTIQEHGIRVNACFVLGLDGQGPEVFEEVYGFVRKAAPFEVQVTVQTPFPGTPLYRQLEQEDRLLFPGQWQRCTLFDVNFRPRGMSPGTLRTGLRDLVARLYTEEETQWRRAAFKTQRRRARQRRMAG